MSKCQWPSHIFNEPEDLQHTLRKKDIDNQQYHQHQEQIKNMTALLVDIKILLQQLLSSQQK